MLGLNLSLSRLKSCCKTLGLDKMSRKYGSNNSAKPKYAGLKLKNRLVKAQEINTCSSPAQHKQLFPEKKSSAYVQQHDRRSAGRIIEEIHQMSSQNYISRIGASKQRSITLFTSLLKCFSLIYAHAMFYWQWFFSLFICRSLLLFRDVLSQKGLPPSSKAIIHFISIPIHYISSCFAKCSTGSLSPDINTTPFYH